MKYEQIYDGVWRAPIRRGYRLGCCDCGLTHTIDFRLVKEGNGHRIEFRMTRNNRATAQKRKKKLGRLKV
jgi:hypothetical protein